MERRIPVELLKKLLEERAVSPSAYPPFFPFEKKGDTLVGVLKGVVEYEWRGEKRPIAVVESLDGEEYSVSLTTVLQRLFNQEKPEPGDYVLIRYEGEGQAVDPSRNPPKLFALGVVRKSEAEELARRAEEARRHEERREKREKPAEPERPPEILEFPAPAEAAGEAAEAPEAAGEPGKPAAVPEDLVEFLRKLFTFYDEGMNLADLEKRLRYKGYTNISGQQIVAACPFLVYDPEKNWVKMRADSLR